MALHKDLLYVLKGVAIAAEADAKSEEDAGHLLAAIQLPDTVPRRDSFGAWLQAVVIDPDQKGSNAANIVMQTVAIAYMRYRSIHATPEDSLSPQDLDLIWTIVSSAILSPLYASKWAIRSHQGFLQVPLCDLRRPNGDNEALWRLHLWLPNRPVPDPDFLIHSHKSYGQSWILAGEGTNGDFVVDTVQDIADATHAPFAPVGQAPLTHKQLTSASVNTGQFVRVKDATYETHSRNMSYVVPAAAYHSSKIPLDKVHATVFFFDASRGYSQEAGVLLGPKEIQRIEQDRNPGGFKAVTIANVINNVRSWEIALEDGMSLTRESQYLKAKGVFEAMVTDWKPILDDADANSGSSLNDLKSLVRYVDLAGTLSSWVDHIGRGRENLANGNAVAARKEFEQAKQKCQEVSDPAVADQCEAILAAYYLPE